MTTFRYGEPQLFEAFVKSAQYVVRLRTQQDIWDQNVQGSPSSVPWRQ
jgi:hypothetical protein